MITVSEIKTTAPAVCKTDLQKAVYQTLGELRIPYERVDTDEVITDVLSEEWYGCSDGTTTGYMKVLTTQITGDFLSYAKHTPAIIEV